MLDDHLTLSVTLRTPTGVYSDGKPTYSETPAKAMALDFSQRDIDAFGAIKNGKIFLTISAVAPVAQGQIVSSGVTYDIQAVKTCVRMGVGAACYRVAVVSG